MSPTPKSTREFLAEEPAKTLHFFAEAAMIYGKGIECMAEIQNKTIDCAAQQNKELVKLWKQVAEKAPWAPRVNIFDGYAGTLDRLTEVQKAMVHLALQQTRIFVEVVKERTTAASDSIGTLSNFAQQSFDQSLAAQKKAAEAVAAEASSAFDKARERFSVPGGEDVAESIRRSVDSIITAQKDLLETASSRWTPAPETVTTA